MLTASFRQAFNDSNADVRKAVVFCLVDIYMVLGPQFEAHLGELNASQVTLHPIRPPLPPVCCAFSPSRRHGSNEPQAGTQAKKPQKPEEALSPAAVGYSRTDKRAWLVSQLRLVRIYINRMNKARSERAVRPHQTL